MVKLKEEGVVRAIGTSNFGTREMVELRADAPQGHPPVIHQISTTHTIQVGRATPTARTLVPTAGRISRYIVAYCPLNAWPSKLHRSTTGTSPRSQSGTGEPGRAGASPLGGAERARGADALLRCPPSRGPLRCLSLSSPLADMTIPSGLAARCV